jgi:colicin import membrane protein
VVEVRLLQNGTVAKANLVKLSGVPAYDRAIMRAIEKTERVPVPDDIELFQQLRDLTLVFRPSD